MGSGRHHSRRERSPSPSSDSDSSSGRSVERRSHRSQRSQKPRSSPRDPPPSYSSKRPDLKDRRRPEINRSLSEDTYRHITGNKQSSRSNTVRDRGGDRGGDRGSDRDRRSRRHRSDDDDYYYYDKHGRAHNRSLSDRSRSSSSSRSRDRRGGDRHDKPASKMETFKPIVEDVLAAFGVVQAKHAKDDHRGGHGSSRGYGHDDRDHRSSRSPRSRSQDGTRGRSNEHSGHHEYIDSMMDPNKVPNKQTAALRAAITAAALEAFRTRKEGGITPERLFKIAGAAIAAGGLDAIVQRDKKQGHGHEGGNTRELIESVILGMKSSSAFGHRIRREHGLGTGDQMKHRLMQAATTKLMDRPFGSKDKSLHPPNRRSRSSTGLTSLMRSMTVK